MDEVGFTITTCPDGDIFLVFKCDENNSYFELKSNPSEMRKICWAILSACDQVDMCFYSPAIGRA